MPSNLPPGFEYEDAPQSTLPPGFEYEEATGYRGQALPSPETFKSGPAKPGTWLADKESAPGQMTPDELQANMSPSARSQYVNNDIAKSALTGGRKFVGGVFGTPGMAEEYAGKAMDLVHNNLINDNPAEAWDYEKRRMLPNEKEVNAAIEKHMPSAFKPYLAHEPQTTQGKVAEIGMEIVPGFATLGVNKVARGVALAKAPTAKQWAEKTGQLYDKLKGLGVEYHRNDYAKLLGDVGGKLDSEGYSQELAPKAYSIYNKMLAGGGQAPTFSQVDTMKKTAQRLLYSADKEERGAAGLLLGHIRDFEDKAGFTSATPISPRELNALRNEARQTASQNTKIGRLQAIEQTARELPPEDYERTVKAGLKSYLKSKEGQRFLSPAEKAQLRKASSLTVLEGTKVGSGRLGQMIASGVGTIAGGGPLSPAGLLQGAATGAGTALLHNLAQKASALQRGAMVGKAIRTVRAGPGKVPRALSREEQLYLMSMGLPAVASSVVPDEQ